MVFQLLILVQMALQRYKLWGVELYLEEKAHMSFIPTLVVIKE